MFGRFRNGKDIERVSIGNSERERDGDRGIERENSEREGIDTRQYSLKEWD